MLSLFLGSIFVSAVTGTATTSVFGSYKAVATTITDALQYKIPYAKNKCPVPDQTTVAKATETWPVQAVAVASGELTVRVAPRTAGAASDKFTFVVKTGQEWGISKTFHEADALKSSASLECDTDGTGTAASSFYPSKDCETPRYTLVVTENAYYNETTYVFTAASTAPKQVTDNAAACTKLTYKVPSAAAEWDADAGCTFKTGSTHGFYGFQTSTKLKQGAVTFEHSLSDTSAPVESPEVYINEATSEISDLVISTSSSAGRGRGNVTWKFTAPAAAAAGYVNGLIYGITANDATSQKILSSFKLNAGKVIFESHAECYMYQGTAAAKSNEVHYTFNAAASPSEITFTAPKFEAGEVVLTCNNALNPVSAELNTTFGYVSYSVWSAVTGDTVCKSNTAADSGLTKAGTNTDKVFLQDSKYIGFAPLGAIAEADFDGACSVGAGVLSSFLVVAASLMCA